MNAMTRPALDASGRPIYDHRTKMKVRTPQMIQDIKRVPVGFPAGGGPGDSLKHQFAVRRIGV